MKMLSANLLRGKLVPAFSFKSGFKTLVILKFVPKAGFFMYTGENRPT
jgi:hypothetical protein